MWLYINSVIAIFCLVNGIHAPRYSGMHSVTDDDFLKDRERILAEIKALNEQLKENEIALRVFHRFKTSVRETPPKTPKVRENARRAKEASKSAPAENQEAKPIKMAAVVCKVIFMNTDEFTTNTIAEYLQKHFPDIAARLPPSYISTLLWRLANNGKVAVVRKEHGKPNVYVVISKK